MLDGAAIELMDDVVAARQNDTNMSIDVLQNDIFPDDYDGAKEITAVSYGSQGGTVSISNDSKSLIYRPPADFAGQEKLTYFVDNQAFAEVRVEIVSPLNDDEYSIPPDGIQRNLDLLDNDPFWRDYQGDKIITLVSTAVHGEVEISGDGRSVLYTPAPDGRGRDSFVYIVDELYPAEVRITVPQTLRHDEYEIIQNTVDVQLDVLGNDPFWPTYNRDKIITAVSEPRFGTATISEDGKSIIYSPENDRSGYVSFSYVVDHEFETSVSVIVHRPVRDDWFEIDFDSTRQSLDVISNDYYRNRNGFPVDVIDRVTDVLDSENGATITIAPGGQSVLYSAPEGFSGVDRFTYIADGNQPAHVSVSVTRPVRNDYFHRLVFQDTPNATLPVKENDFIGNGYKGNKVITSIDTTDSRGTVEIAGSYIRYSPAEQFTGNDNFKYTIDGELEANVNVYVNPLAQNDRFRFCVNHVSPNETLNVLANDYFDRGYVGPQQITSVHSIDSGNLEIHNNQVSLDIGSQRYHQFEYTVDDKYTANASVSIRSHTQWDSFVVHQNSDTNSLDVLANDFPTRQHGSCLPQHYRGPRKITAIGESENGGTVSLDPISHEIQYKPPVDFLGVDRFTYEVDGLMQQTVQLNVIRHARDDAYQVSGNSAESLRVLVNDLFSGGYQGAGKITDVSSTSAGATISVADDGASIQYQAPDGFRGEDKFIYTVDGKQKAEVTVTVDGQQEDKFARFASMAELEEFLIADALQRYAWQFGGFVFNRDSDEFLADAPGLAPDARDHSETNVQVEGIDEGDIVEFDADYVYTLSGQELVIVDAWPGEEVNVVSRTLIDGKPEVEFLQGDRLTVISTITETIWPEDVENPIPDGGPDILGPDAFGVDFDFWWPQPIEINYFTIATVFDITDRAAPKMIQKSTLEGQFLESRAVGDFVYLVVNNDAIASGPEIIEEELDNGETQLRYETVEEYEARLRANTNALIDDALPNYTSVDGQGNLARSGLMNTPEEIYKPIAENSINLLSVVSLNINSNEPGLAESAAVYTAGGSVVYASRENFYVFDTSYQSGIEDNVLTRIHKFHWEPEAGTVSFTATGFVPGTMINQFSADESNGHLRIATTIRNSGSGNWSGQSENTLFVLREDAGTLEYEGSLFNLGLNETLQSVRFMGERAFAVTYRNVDPMFGLDLSDHQNPKSVGAVPLPGLSTYMQFITQDRVLTVGINTPNGFIGPAQVSIFDVSNLAAPRIIDEYTFERFSTTEAGVDHHAFGYFARHGLLALPSTRSYVQRVDTNNDGFRETQEWVSEHALYIFAIDATVAGRDDSAIQLVSEIEHESKVRRSGYIGDKVFSIADDSIHVVDVANPAEIIGTVEDLTQIEVDEPPVFWPPWPIFADAAMNAAAGELADRLDVDPGQVVRVVTEPTATGIEFVLRVGDEHYLYAAKDETDITLESESYQFPEGIVWQNPANPFDVNGDGEVAPNDAIIQINRLQTFGSEELPTDVPVRQIQRSQNEHYYFDSDGDGFITASDVIRIVNHINERQILITDPGHVEPDANQEIIDSIFDQVRGAVGDANLDGRFDSKDLVLVFQHGEYEDNVENNSTWSRGDWDGDLDFTTRDLVFAFQNGSYQFAAKSADDVDSDGELSDP